MDQQRRRLWGRSLSRPLSPTLQSLYTKGMDAFSYIPNDLDFWQRYESYVLEIGFGNGEHFIEMARAHPDKGFLGCERFINGVAKVVKSLFDENVMNVRLFVDDVHLLMDSIPCNHLSKIYILFPDPWPKKRHTKRRLLQRDFMKQCHSFLAPGGVLCMASDIDDYRDFIQEEMTALPDLFTLEQTTDAPLTKYGRKAIREGRTSKMFVYKKV